MKKIRIIIDVLMSIHLGLHLKTLINKINNLNTKKRYENW